MTVDANRRGDALKTAATLRRWLRKDFDIWVLRVCRPEHDVRPKARTNDQKMARKYHTVSLNAAAAGTAGLGCTDRGLGRWAGRHRER
jgi:hypothetical protein